MRRTISQGMICAGLMFLACAAPARAEDCAERFARLHVMWYENPESGIGHVVSETVGQPKSDGEMHFVANGHYMLKQFVPAGGWYLTHDGTTWQSTDEGASWKKLYSFDQADTWQKGLETVQQQASTVRNAVCGEDTVDGEAVDTLEADMTNTVNATYEIHEKVWVRRSDERAVRTETLTTGLGPDTFTTQTWTRVPDLEIPPAPQ
ncbi:MAG: hypothetical protein H6878_03115 [Rhodobiaceae bacterium]|nr:hypothetical protein [Rhodobiaceae bacterium]MCC0053485.1 hypothetical protein [Rhodobiaceae bacterium]